MLQVERWADQAGLDELAEGYVAAVAATYGGAKGAVEGLRPGSVVVNMSTVLPATIRAQESAVRARGAGILDAPVSGSVATAASGTLAIMVGGTAADLATARPALEAMGSSIFHLGPLGSGAAMKLAVNTVVFGLNQALAEGLVLAERSGVDRSVAYEVLVASSVGAPYLRYKEAAFLAPEATPTAFALAQAAKDLRLIGEQAAATGAAMPQAGLNLAEIRAAAYANGPDADFATVAVRLRRGARALATGDDQSRL